MNVKQQIDQLSSNFNVILENIVASSVLNKVSDYLKNPHVLAQIFATPVCIFEATEEQKVQQNLPSLVSDGNVLWVHQSVVDQLCDAVSQKSMAQSQALDIQKEVFSWFEDLAEKRYEKVTYATSDFKQSLLKIHQNGLYAQNVKLSCLDTPEQITQSWHAWVNECISSPHCSVQKFEQPIQSRFMVPLVVQNIRQRMDALHAYAHKDLTMMFGSQRCTASEILASLIVLEKYPKRVIPSNEDRQTSIRLSMQFAQTQAEQIRQDLNSYVTSEKSADFAVDILKETTQKKFEWLTDEEFIRVQLKYMVKHNAPIDYMLAFMMSVDKTLPWAADLTESIFFECKNNNRLTDLALILAHNKYPHLITKDVGQETLLGLLDEKNPLHRLTITNSQDLRNKLKASTGGAVVSADFSTRKKP